MVKSQALNMKNNDDIMVVSVVAPRVHEEEEIAEEVEGADEETAEPEVISKGKSDEENTEE